MGGKGWKATGQQALVGSFKTREKKSETTGEWLPVGEYQAFIQKQKPEKSTSVGGRSMASIDFLLVLTILLLTPVSYAVSELWLAGLCYLLIIFLSFRVAYLRDLLSWGTKKWDQENWSQD